MVRSSKHVLKYQTEVKSSLLSQLFHDFKIDLQFYIDLLWDEKLPLKNNLSSKLLPPNIIKHSQYKQIIYKQASEIIRSNKMKNKTSKPIVKNVSINIDARLFDIQKSTKIFDEFIHLRLPYFEDNKKRAKFIRLPIKFHKQSLKYKDWNRNDCIKLTEKQHKYFAVYSYETIEPPKRTEGTTIGIDQGYKKLIIISDDRFIGKEFEKLYEDISRKKQGSKNFKDLLIERDKKINEVINKIDLSGIREIVIENLKNVKKGKTGKRRIHKKFMNKLQRWSYCKVVIKLERFCEENGILLTKINPAYTSQTCSNCGSIHKESRVLERYKCIDCGYEADADLNAAIVISLRGVYNPSTTTKLKTFVNCDNN